MVYFVHDFDSKSFYLFWIWKRIMVRTCVQSVCAECTFTLVLLCFLTKLFLDLLATRRKFCTLFYTEFIVFLLFLDAQNPRSLGCYKEILHFLQSVLGSLVYVFACVKIMTIFCYSLPFKMFQDSFGWDSGVFWAFWGGLLVAVFFIVLAGVQIMTIFSRSLSSKVLQNSFGRPRGLLGLLWSSLCSYHLDF